VGYEIAASPFGLLAMTAPKNGVDRLLIAKKEIPDY